MTTQIYARQGDLTIRRHQIENATGLRLVRDAIVAGSASGHPHTIAGAALLRVDGRTTFVRLATDTSLVHGRAGGHRPVALPAGDYTITPLRERRAGSDAHVDD